MARRYCVVAIKNRKTAGSSICCNKSWTVTKLPKDFDIFSFSSPTVTKPLCNHLLTNCSPVCTSLWAISFVWCGNAKSIPPPWISKWLPRYFVDITEHSMCQPGRPLPHGESQAMAPSPCSPFQTAKSIGSSLRVSSSSSNRPAALDVISSRF